MRRHDWIVVVVVLTGAVGAWFGCVSSRGTPSVDVAPGTAVATRLTVRQDEAAGTIAVYRASGGEPLVTQHARSSIQPLQTPADRRSRSGGRRAPRARGLRPDVRRLSSHVR